MFSNLIPITKYFLLTCKHKYYVFLAGRRIGVGLIRLLLHDISKFYPTELPHYGRQFFGKADQPYNFIHCWLKHQNRNTHHWEYYIPRTGHDRCDPPYQDNQPIPMPEQSIREMVADWIGASCAYEGKWPEKNNWWWFNNRFDKIKVHENTRKRILEILERYWEKYG